MLRPSILSMSVNVGEVTCHPGGSHVELDVLMEATSMATSSSRDEYKATFTPTIKHVYLRHLLVNLGWLIWVYKCSPLLTSTLMVKVHWTRNQVFYVYTEHIKVHYHYARQRLHVKKITLACVPTHHNVAEDFTKPLSREKFEAF